MADIYNLQRFLDAQERGYDTVLDELRAGRKSSHWIWFIFPQITGLGHSGMAQQFAIASSALVRSHFGRNQLRRCRGRDRLDHEAVRADPGQCGHLG